MLQEDFTKRLTSLRQRKGVSARDMSLSIGQNAGYINNIETGKALPSMASFFFICEYLDITPQEFFDWDNRQPERLRTLVEQLKRLNDEYFNHIAAIVERLTEDK